VKEKEVTEEVVVEIESMIRRNERRRKKQ